MTLETPASRCVMSIDSNNPSPGRVDQTTNASLQAQQAAARREERRQRVEPLEDAERPKVTDEERRAPKGPISLSGPSSSDVLKRVADYARKLPQPEDLLAVQASANTFALINLDAAKAIAREVRESIDRGDAPGVGALQAALFSDNTERGEVADTLAG
jgi:hypothetical protein